MVYFITMSSVSLPFPPGPSDEPVFRLSVEQYHAMIEKGVLTDDDPVELLEGILVFKMPKKPLHRYVVRALTRAIERLLSADWFVQSQEPITLSTSEPEPDISIIHGAETDYLKRHPGPGETALLIEVSDTTLGRDRGIKLRTYASAGIPVYWVLNLENRTIEVFTDPIPDEADPRYTHSRRFNESEPVPLELSGSVVGQIVLASIFP